MIEIIHVTELFFFVIIDLLQIENVLKVDSDTRLQDI